MTSETTEAPTLGLDLDGCIDEAPDFFSTLSKVWPGKVIVVTFRDDEPKAEADLARFGIRYDNLVLVERLEAKAGVIVENGISVYVDDQPEALKNIPPTVAVLLMRNGGNFDPQDRLWTLSGRTGKLT
ncbi:hypothetical protein TA3x_000540 [Tundrisphaera sp. TA3]|uniref:hypothetical protein n=1 Tax=Tundrisphaera sp. TA3 TaxID=3435775 RepID=UPI003EBFF876